MPIGELCRGEPITATKDTSIQEAAKLMKANNVGMLVIVEEKGADSKPLGVITDRRIANVLADTTDLNKITVGDIMNQEVLTVKYREKVQRAIETMCAWGVRRAAVVDDNQKLVGVVSLDDLVVLLADEMSSIAKLIRKQVTNTGAFY